MTSPELELGITVARKKFSFGNDYDCDCDFDHLWHGFCSFLYVIRVMVAIVVVLPSTQEPCLLERVYIN